MNILSWNCHELGNTWTLQFPKDLVIQKKPSIVFFCETISRRSQMERVRVTLEFDGMIVVDVNGRSGGIALLWKVGDEVPLLGFSDAYIDVRVASKGVQEWHFTGVYGEPNRSRRASTWNLLRTLANNSTLPWCVTGDLNNVLSHDDKRGGNRYPNFLIQGFQ
ncbi:hypothetical protein CsatA_027007 [Cannabis sativa]